MEEKRVPNQMMDGKQGDERKEEDQDWSGLRMTRMTWGASVCTLGRDVRRIESIAEELFRRPEPN